MAQAETTLITPRRNFLVRALGFTAAGAALSIPIITIDDAKKRMEHHAKELEKAWREYYGAGLNVRTVLNANALGAVEEGRHSLSCFMICAGGNLI